MVGSDPVGGGQSFSEVVIGCVDPVATADFLALFGLTDRTTEELSPAEASGLFGAPDGSTATLVLHSPACTDRSAVRLVGAAEPGRLPAGWEHGPRALDIYTTDISSSVASASSAGFSASSEAVIAGGPMRMTQVLVSGPGGLPVVLVESTHRRASVCDLPDGPQHSEPHSVVWAVGDQAAESGRWAGTGWTAGAGISFAEPTVSDELALPERPTSVSMNMLSDEQVNPIRLELMTFDDHADEGAVPDLPLVPHTAGIQSLVAEVDSLADARAAWRGSARFSDVVPATAGNAMVGVTAGGVRFVLRERS